MLDQFQATYLQNWPKALRDLSFATALMPLANEERLAIVAEYLLQNGDDDENPALTDCWPTLCGRLQSVIDQFPDGAFIRLGSRSPKDSWSGRIDQFRATTSEQALSWLGESERVCDDIQRDIAKGDETVIAVREWRRIPHYEEWRVFVRDGAIVAVSQYDYFHAYQKLAIPFYRDAVRWTIDQYWQAGLSHALGSFNNVVVDLWVHRRVQQDAATWEARLIEINPWGRWTDPCLCAWDALQNDPTPDAYTIVVKDVP